MVRKKKKHQEDPADDILDSSSDEVGDAAEGGSTTCSHQRSSVGLRRLRQQVLRNPVRLDVCDDCEAGEAQPETWLCLQCGHRGCGGTAKHGVRHSETPHSDSHAIALSGQTLQLWCFPCNNWVEANPQVTQIIQNLKKKMASSSKKAKATAVQAEGEEPAAETNCVDAGSGDVKEQRGLGQTPLLQPLLAKRCASKLQCTFDPVSTVEGSETPELGSLNVELPGPGPLTSALALFLQELRMGSPHPRALFSKVCQVAPHFRGHQQHDSHELLRHLLEGVRAEEVKRQKQAVLQAFGLSSKVDPNKVEPDTKAKIQAYKKAVARTPLDDIFGGILLSTIVCQQCGKVSRREEPFQDLSLPIPEEKPPRGSSGAHSTPRGRGARRKALEGGSSAATKTPNREALTVTKGPAEGSLEASLRSFTAPELLAGANGLHCEGCKSARAAASLQLQVFEAPRVLTLHLKRFQQGATLRKVQKHVPFPVELDLTPFCCRDAEMKAPATYILYGVVEHAGRMTGGHYTAYVRGAGGSWFHASDSRVVPTTQQKVLASQAYLLFYCRADTLQE
ncbi:hypothetical protein MTO96_010750 [Rhipicephalus appendiculatus]